MAAADTVLRDALLEAGEAIGAEDMAQGSSGGGVGGGGRGRERREEGDGSVFGQISLGTRVTLKEDGVRSGCTPFTVAHGAQSTKSWAASAGRP